jgi:adenine specific DNA methylase Mod
MCTKRKLFTQQHTIVPSLYWEGKSSSFEVSPLPLQPIATYFSDSFTSINELIFGDNLQVLATLLETYEGKIDLIYIDPPFDSKANYKKRIELKGTEKNKQINVQQIQYTDRWEPAAYLQFIYERLILLHRLLAPTGSIYVHCDWRKAHSIKLVLDEIFGEERYRNEIIWKRGTVKGAKAKGNQFARNHDSIFFYTKSEQYTFNRPYLPFDEAYKKRFNKDDKDGKGPYRDDQAIGTRSKQTIEVMKKMGKIYKVKGKWRIKTYLQELQGIVVDDNWTDIPEVNVMSKDRTMYPTQKPEQLLTRMIEASTNEGDLILDCFCGSGTTAAVAAKLKRNFIAIDNNIGAIMTTSRRLQQLQVPFQMVASKSTWPAFIPTTDYTIDLIEQTLHIHHIDFSLLKKQVPQLRNIPFLHVIEQVEIDWQYDGEIFRPTQLQLATKHQAVPLVYNIPSTMTKIALQITDVYMNVYFIVLPDLL